MAAGAAATAALRRRRSGASSSSSSASAGGGAGLGAGGGNMLRFYTEDSPGLKITPTVVLAMSLCFIAFVSMLHVFGKIYNYKRGGA